MGDANGTFRITINSYEKSACIPVSTIDLSYFFDRVFEPVSEHLSAFAPEAHEQSYTYM